MYLRNLVYLLSVVLLSVSCNSEEHTHNDVEEQSLETFQFPEIISLDKEDSLVLENRNWIGYGEHHPYYIGELADTINIERYIAPITLPPPPDTDSSQWKYKPIKGPFDKYFLDWQEYRDYTTYDSTILSIELNTSKIINTEGMMSYPVLIKNNSTDTIYIGYGDIIPVITEALDQDGVWLPIEKRFVYMCGVGLHSIILPPDEVVITSELIYTGSFKTKLRLKLGISYSREFDGSINLSQFESEWDEHGNKKTLPNKD